MIYLKYLKSLLIHKWFVLIAGLKVGKIPIWRLAFHDWTKFLPVEFIAYSRHFYGDYPDNSEVPELLRRLPSWNGKTKQDIQLSFDYAWLHHQNTNPHHWQYWIIVYDDEPEKVKCLPIPETYVYEMVADWAGAGRAYNGKWEVNQWYEKSKEKILLHPDTRVLVEKVIKENYG